MFVFLPSGFRRKAVSKIEAKLNSLGVALPFAWVRMRGNHAYVSGHAAVHQDGSLAGPFGKVGTEVLAEQAYDSARQAALAILASLKRELGDLDCVTAWLRVFGMVNSAPGFSLQPQVINGFSDLIIKLYGPEAGAHARSAVGVAELPFGFPSRSRLRSRSVVNSQQSPWR
jgi:enamine deaminase RidA (YjgF/YER057c/UK114 family)